MQLDNIPLLRTRYSAWLLVCIFLYPVASLYAIPKDIRSIIKVLEGDHRGKNPAKAIHIVDAGVEQSDLAQERVANLDAMQTNDHVEERQVTDVDAKAYTLCMAAQADINKAIEHVKLAKHPSTWYYRGIIYERLLRFKPFSQEATCFLKEALESYAHVQKMTTPTNQFHSFACVQLVELWTFFFKKGIAYYNQEIFDQALKCFALCRGILPDEPTPILYLGMVYHAMQNYKFALENYEAYLESGSAPQVAVYQAIAHIKHVHLQQTQQAIDILDKALAKWPFENKVLQDKFYIYASSRNLDTYAQTLLDATVNGSETSNQDFMKRLYAYAYCLAYQCHIDQAIVYYKKILQKDPAQYHTLSQLGYLYYHQAIDTYKLCIKFKQEQSTIDAISDLFRHRIHDHHKLIYPLNFQDYIYQNPIVPLKLKPIEQFLLWLTKGIDKLFSPVFVCPRTVWFLQFMTFENIFCISTLYRNRLQQDSNLWTYHNLHAARIQFKTQLQKAIFYFQKAYKQNKQDKALLKALYYSCYYLNKHHTAKRLYRIMKSYNQELSQEDDPFML